jgi:hypothetical protein
MNQYIYEAKDAIEKTVCNEIIELFEKENHNNRFVSNLMIEDENDTWYSISKILKETIFDHVIKYTIKIDDNISRKINYDFNAFSYTNISVETFVIKKLSSHYNNETSFSNDFTIIEPKNETSFHRYSVLNFIIYLNNVEKENSTTLFYNNTKIKPEIGKIAIFPASWAFSYKEDSNLCENKYIIKGCLHYDCVYF